MVGLLIAAWVVFGRKVFGVDGSLTLIYTLSLGPAIVVANMVAAMGIHQVALKKQHLKPVTFIVIVAGWVCGILLGLLIPDETETGLRSIAVDQSIPGILDFVIGIANPLGIFTVGLPIASYFLARSNAKGIREEVPEEDYDYPQGDQDN